MELKARKFYQRTGKKIIINGSDTARYDKTKVECFNCHKMGHFARECRNLRSQENRSRNQDSSRRTVNVEESSSKAMLAIDGAGVDWSYMTEEEVPTNFTLMAFSDSEVCNLLGEVNHGAWNMLFVEFLFLVDVEMKCCDVDDEEAVGVCWDSTETVGPSP
ncbi:ribonuclease H-like domain-containing protein [Tanacetum coccineum]